MPVNRHRRLWISSTRRNLPTDRASDGTHCVADCCRSEQICSANVLLSGGKARALDSGSFLDCERLPPPPKTPSKTCYAPRWAVAAIPEIVVHPC